ncbi:MAG: ribulose-phosphate 3-epimerase [Candidatus ainarchaeum sp.]|nr:ribulose-phosphate 3-epimerase [Candidatus ainarchaeum sp.]
MGGANGNLLEVEVIPAILVKTKEEFIKNVKLVKDYVKEVHIDVMDNAFVPNYTIKPEEVEELPDGILYEFHWMVEEPEKWIKKTPGNHLHQIHIETVKNWEKIKSVVKEAGGRLCVVLNPDTPVKKIEEYVNDVQRILVMFVVPGYSHQRYIESMEEKVKYLREKYPKIEIEVDGGINFETAKKAGEAGADKFVSCSTIFSSENPEQAIEKLKRNAYQGAEKWLRKK